MTYSCLQSSHNINRASRCETVAAETPRCKLRIDDEIGRAIMLINYSAGIIINTFIHISLFTKRPPENSFLRETSLGPNHPVVVATVTCKSIATRFLPDIIPPLLPFDKSFARERRKCEHKASAISSLSSRCFRVLMQSLREITLQPRHCKRAYDKLCVPARQQNILHLCRKCDVCRNFCV